jgi:hypothetical protein
MRHDHQRGMPLDPSYEWCKACVTQGITTAEEAAYDAPSRKKFQVGMTVKWSRYDGTRSNGSAIWTSMIGQLWSQAPKASYYSKDDNWWVVTGDQRIWGVREFEMSLVSPKKGADHVRLV